MNEYLLSLGQVLIPLAAYAISFAFIMGKYSSVMSAHEKAISKILDRIDNLNIEMSYFKGWIDRNSK